MNTLLTRSRAVALTAIYAILSSCPAAAQFTAVFTDTFDVTTDTSNINLETATRQSGSLSPIDYLANTPDPTDGFQHQLFSAATAASQPLQLAAVGTLTAPAPVFAFPAMVSPDFNFTGSAVDGILGKRITFDLDVGSMVDESAGLGRFINTGITIGSSVGLVDKENTREIIGEPATPYLSISFVEDTFNTNDPNSVDSNFIQVFDSTELVVTRANHEQGPGPLSVQIDITDPSDGDPWDGVGSTAVEVLVNGTSITSYEKLDGGYSDNFITLWGDRNFAGNTLATHTFDNFTVFAAPAVIANDDADFDDDGDVDGVDFLTLQRGFGLTGQTDKSNGDANGDGDINAVDLGIFETQYGSPAPAASLAAVPEPTTTCLLVMASLCTLIRRQRP